MIFHSRASYHTAAAAAAAERISFERQIKNEFLLKYFCHHHLRTHKACTLVARLRSTS